METCKPQTSLCSVVSSFFLIVLSLTRGKPVNFLDKRMLGHRTKQAVSGDKQTGIQIIAQ